MNIEINKDEYPDLLELLYIAHWVLTAHKTEEDPRSEKCIKVIQKLYSLAGKMGHDRLIGYDPASREYFATTEFEGGSQARAFIDEFVDHSFWDELIIRLAERDAARQAGGYENLRALGDEERYAIEEPLEETYSEEFTRHGLDNVAIVERFGPDGEKPMRTSD
jgi:hypothetical protein